MRRCYRCKRSLSEKSTSKTEQTRNICKQCNAIQCTLSNSKDLTTEKIEELYLKHKRLTNSYRKILKERRGYV